VTTIDCLVLSGGGAKGAYGAGVAKALARYRALKNVQSSMCYIGTSAGALNAAVLAAHDADALIGFWAKINPRTVLGARIRNTRFQWVLHLLTRPRFFSVYRNKGLRKLIAGAISLQPMVDRGAHLIVAATNYSKAELRAFYVSPLIDSFISDDASQLIADRRLGHFKKITDDNELRLALLASASIPLFFPPVEIASDWYVDGGVGNHTPTREAAYFLRYLEKKKLGTPGEVYCITQDPPGTLPAQELRFSSSEILKHTLDIYHFVHTYPIVRAWPRINDEVVRHEQHIQDFLASLSGQGLTQQQQKNIEIELRKHLGTLGGATARQHRDLIEIEPSTDLGDTLDFDPERIKETIIHGYKDALGVFKDRGKIVVAEYDQLINQSPFTKS
jgi:hypothetical protein